MIPVLAPQLQTIAVQPTTPIKRARSTKGPQSLKKIFSKDKEVKFETPVWQDTDSDEDPGHSCQQNLLRQ